METLWRPTKTCQSRWRTQSDKIMDRIHHYIGPDELRQLSSERHSVTRSSDVLDWIARTKQTLEHGSVTATFIVDTGGQLWVADRRSEHVACAAGQPVLSAGEMTFDVEGSQVSVAAVSNQSLGYCPEPASWPAVAAALENSGLPAPEFFTSAYVLRQCESCGTKNIVKDGIFECGVCGSSLPRTWNFEKENP